MKTTKDCPFIPSYGDEPGNLKNELPSWSWSQGCEGPQGGAGPGVPSCVSPVVPFESAEPPLQGNGLALNPSLARSMRSCRAWYSLWLVEGDRFLGLALWRAGGVRTPSCGCSDNTGGSVGPYVRP